MLTVWFEKEEFYLYNVRNNIDKRFNIMSFKMIEVIFKN